jgi:hypothetical protein
LLVVVCCARTPVGVPGEVAELKPLDSTTVRPAVGVPLTVTVTVAAETLFPLLGTLPPLLQAASAIAHARKHPILPWSTNGR